MKIKIKKTKLLDALSNVTIAIDKATLYRSYIGVKIVVSESNIRLIASDGDFAVKEIIEKTSGLEIIEPGKVLVDGKLLNDIVKKQKDMIELEADDHMLHVRSEKIKTNLSLMNVNDYPGIDFNNYGEEFEINSKVLHDAIEQVSYAASIENVGRIILTGINIKVYDGWLTVSATNSSRLATKKIKVDNNDLDINFIIRSKYLKHLLPKNLDENIMLNISNKKILTKRGNVVYTTNLISGVYPDVDKLIPTEFNTVVTMDSKVLRSNLDTALVINNNEGNRATKLTINEGSMIIESKKAEIGDSKVEINDFEIEGKPIEIVFNAIYLKQALQNIKGKVKIKFISNLDRFILEDEEDEKYIQLILPQRSY